MAKNDSRGRGRYSKYLINSNVITILYIREEFLEQRTDMAGCSTHRALLEETVGVICDNYCLQNVRVDLSQRDYHGSFTFNHFGHAFVSLTNGSCPLQIKLPLCLSLGRYPHGFFNHHMFLRYRFSVTSQFFCRLSLGTLLRAISSS